MCVLFSDLIELSSSTKMNIHEPRLEHKPIDTTSQTPPEDMSLSDGIHYSSPNKQAHNWSTPVVTIASHSSNNTMEGNINVTFISDYVERTFNRSVYNIQTRHSTITSSMKIIRCLEMNTLTTTNTSTIGKYIVTVRTPTSFQTSNNTTSLTEHCINVSTLAGMSHVLSVLTHNTVEIAPNAITTINFNETFYKKLNISTYHTRVNQVNVPKNNTTTSKQTDSSVLANKVIEVRNSTKTKSVITPNNKTTTSINFSSKESTEYNSTTNIVHDKTTNTVFKLDGLFLINKSLHSETNTIFEARNKLNYPVSTHTQHPIIKQIDTDLPSVRSESSNSLKMDTERTPPPNPYESTRYVHL